MNEEKRQRLIDELNGLGSGDIERDHLDADDILVKALALAGYQDIANAWLSACERIGFWYA